MIKNAKSKVKDRMLERMPDKMWCIGRMPERMLDKMSEIEYQRRMLERIVRVCYNIHVSIYLYICHGGVHSKKKNLEIHYLQSCILVFMYHLLTMSVQFCFRTYFSV